jgi:hypothetical protein
MPASDFDWLGATIYVSVVILIAFLKAARLSTDRRKRRGDDGETKREEQRKTRRW